MSSDRCWDLVAVGGAVGGAVGAAIGYYMTTRYKMPGAYVKHIGHTSLSGAVIVGFFCVASGSSKHRKESY